MYDSYEDFIRNTGYEDDNIGRAAWQQEINGYNINRISPTEMTVHSGTSWYSPQTTMAATPEYTEGLASYATGKSGGGFAVGADKTFLDANAAKSLGLSSGVYNKADLNKLGEDRALKPTATTDSLSGLDMAKIGLAGVNTAIALGQYGTDKKVAKKQMQLMDTNIKLANDQYADKVNARKTIGRAFS